MLVSSLRQLSRRNNLSKLYSSKSVIPFSHCSSCGNGVNPNIWPQNCNSCGNIRYRNPIPVAVALLPFLDENNVGLLLTKRAITPYIGQYCLPGGHIEYEETWQQAVSREVYEETGIHTDPEEYKCINTLSSDSAPRILIFGLSNRIRSFNKIKDFKPNNEVAEIIIGNDKDNNKLCFPLHQLVYDEFFKNNLFLE